MRCVAAAAAAVAAAAIVAASAAAAAVAAAANLIGYAASTLMCVYAVREVLVCCDVVM